MKRELHIPKEFFNKYDNVTDVSGYEYFKCHHRVFRVHRTDNSQVFPQLKL